MLSDWRRVAALVFAIAWGGNEFTPLLVMYREVGHYSALTVNVLLGAYVLGIIPALLIGGPLSDRFGRRRLLLPAAPIGIVGSLILAAGPSSVAMLSVGRVLSGVALGLAMAVGTTWITELSEVGTGARRASLALTLGFLIGAGIAGALAQWGPWRTALPYLLHAVVTGISWLLVRRVPETHPRASVPGRLLDDLRVPTLGHRRFWRVVVPLAPWVFGAVGSAYAVLPGLMREHSGGVPIAFSALLTVITLGCGFGIQSVGRRIDTRHSARASVVALVLIVAGLSLAAWAAATLSLEIVIVAAAVLGGGYGIALVAGLSEVQRIAGPDDLAGLTSVYYSIAYTGFFVPALLSALSGEWAYPVMFGGGVVLAAVALLVVACGWRAHLPTGQSSSSLQEVAQTGDKLAI